MIMGGMSLKVGVVWVYESNGEKYGYGYITLRLGGSEVTYFILAWPTLPLVNKRESRTHLNLIPN